MRGKRFRLSVSLAMGALTLVICAGVLCQKQKSAEGETSKAAVSSSIPATDSIMTGGNTLRADSSMTGYYTCTMHPQVHEAKPGKCPICGMDLVYKKAATMVTKDKGAAAGRK
jgi:hypothetical protein